MSRPSIAVRRGLAAGCAAVLALLATGGSAVAAPAIPTTTDPAAAAGGWLAGRLTGGSHVNYLGYFDGGTTADVVFAMAAAGVGKTATGRVLDYLAQPANIDGGYADLSGSFGGPYAGSAAKAALAFLVGGRNPSAVSSAGVSLTEALRLQCTAVDISDTATHYCPAVGAGYGTYSSVSESFIVLVAARLGAPLAADSPAMSWFLSLQCPGGGFSSDVPEHGCATNTGEDVDATAYAMMALAAIPAPSAAEHTALTNAGTWLASRQNSDGSWTTQGAHNTDSTGLAAAAARANGHSAAKAQKWLAAQQIRTGPTVGSGATRGALSYANASDEHSRVKGTADGLLGLTGVPLGTVSAAHASASAPVLALAAPHLASKAKQGASIKLSATGFAAKEKVRIQIHSATRTLATVTTSANGSVSTTVLVPAALPAGAHTVTLTGQSSTLSTSAMLAVTAVPSATATGGQPSGLAATGTDGRALRAIAVAGLAMLCAGAGLLVLGRRPGRA